MTDCSKETSSIISALSVNVPMRNLLFVHQCIDGQSGDCDNELMDKGEMMEYIWMIRHSP